LRYVLSNYGISCAQALSSRSWLLPSARFTSQYLAPGARTSNLFSSPLRPVRLKSPAYRGVNNSAVTGGEASRARWSAVAPLSRNSEQGGRWPAPWRHAYTRPCEVCASFSMPTLEARSVFARSRFEEFLGWRRVARCALGFRFEWRRDSRLNGYLARINSPRR